MLLTPIDAEDGSLGAEGRALAPGLDLDEDQRRAVEGDDVELAIAGAGVALDDLPAGGGKLAGDELLGGAADALSAVRSSSATLGAFCRGAGAHALFGSEDCHFRAFGAPRVGFASLASFPCSPRRRPSPSTASPRVRSGSRSTCIVAYLLSPLSACPTPPCARRGSACGRRWSTATSSSRCSGSSPTSPRPACARPGPASTWRSPRRC